MCKQIRGSTQRAEIGVGKGGGTGKVPACGQDEPSQGFSGPEQNLLLLECYCMCVGMWVSPGIKWHWADGNALNSMRLMELRTHMPNALCGLRWGDIHRGDGGGDGYMGVVVQFIYASGRQIEIDTQLVAMLKATD